MIHSGTIRNSIRNLFSGYFALVMATGIIGVGAKNAGMVAVGKLFFILNILIYIILIFLMIARTIFYFNDLARDIMSHEKNPSFLTIVAGSGVLGVQFVTLNNGYLAGVVLWLFSIAVWLLLTLLFFANLMLKPEKPPLDKGLNGIWLMLIVSVQSMAILGSELTGTLPVNERGTLFFDLSFFLLGCGLYLIVITLIFYRLIFFPVNAGETGHSYWINTGAAAISVVSGLTLSEKIGGSGYYIEFLPFIRGITLFLWITGTWWIPAIIILEIWRYFIKRVRPEYNPVQWSMVFVIGMYSLATLLTGRSFDVPFLQPVSRIFLYLGLLLWAVIFGGMCITIVKIRLAEKE